MPHPRCITRGIVTAMALTIRLAPIAGAQARNSVSLDATIGASAASGGKQLYASSGSISGEVTLGVRLHAERALAALGAISVGRRARFEGNGDGRCVIPAATEGTSGQCEPPFPDPNHVGVLGGVEVRQEELSLRALAGPAFYAGDGPSGFGVQTQLVGAIDYSHLALVAAVRESWISRVTGERFRFFSFELGLRVQ